MKLVCALATLQLTYDLLRSRVWPCYSRVYCLPCLTIPDYCGLPLSRQTDAFDIGNLVAIVEKELGRLLDARLNGLEYLVRIVIYPSVLVLMLVIRHIGGFLHHYPPWMRVKLLELDLV